MENVKHLIPTASTRPVDGGARKLVMRQFSQLGKGRLTLYEGNESRRFGTSDLYPDAELVINDASAWRDMVTGGSIGAAEAYVAGDWDSPDLVSLLRFFARNNDEMNGFGDRVSWFTQPARRSLHWLNRNTRSGARKRTSRQAHYDLGNDLFEQFLDPTMMYSAAIFPGKTARWRRHPYTNSIASARSWTSSPGMRWSRSAPAGVDLRCMRLANTAAT